MRKHHNSPEMTKVMLILNNAKNRVDAQRLLIKDGFKIDEAEKLIQRFYKTQRRKPDNHQNQSPKRSSSPEIQKAPLTPRDQHVDLISFSQNV